MVSPGHGSDSGLDLTFDNFFQPGTNARITDTGALSAHTHTLAHTTSSTSSSPDTVFRSNVEEGEDEEVRYSVSICGTPLTLLRSPLCGTGGLLWPAGEHLANHLTTPPLASLLRDKKIVELGSGTGIIGIAIAKRVDLGTGRIVATDLGKVLDTLRLNVTLNGLSLGAKTETDSITSPATRDTKDTGEGYSGRGGEGEGEGEGGVGNGVVHVRTLEWGTQVPHDLIDCDVLILADCIYLESLFLPLLQTITQLMTKEGARGFICYKKRRKADTRFFKMMRKAFEVVEVCDGAGESREEVRKSGDGVQVFEFQRKSGNDRKKFMMG